MALLTLALPLFAACGGGDDDDDSGDDTSSSSSSKDEKVKVETWTKGLCTSLLDWFDDIGTSSALADIDATQSADEVKKAMVAFFEDVDERTKEFKDDVDDLGYPDTKDGKKIQASLSGAAGDMVKIFEDSLKDVKAIDAKDPAKMAESLTAIGEALNAAGDEVGEAFTAIEEDYDTEDINKAAEDIPECEGVFNS